jgi:hypothetical protein
MMFKVIPIQQFFPGSKRLFGMSVFVAITLQTVSSIAAQVAKLNNWRFYPEGGKLEINLSAGKTPSYFYLPQPPRIVLDIPDTTLGNIPTEQNYNGAVQRIRVAQLNANVTRIVLDLAAGVFVDPSQVQLQPISRQNPTRWVLRLLLLALDNWETTAIHPVILLLHSITICNYPLAYPLPLLTRSSPL